MKLCSVDDVRDRLRLAHRLDDVQWLDGLIQSTSELIQDYLNRKLAQGTYTEYHDGGLGVIWLKAYPVSSVSSVEISYDGRWTSPTALSSSDYVWAAETGELEYLVGTFPVGRRRVRVTYTGGYAEDSKGILQVPKVIRQACVDQVAYFYMHRNNIGLSQVSVEAGTVAGLSEWGLLPGVMRMLRPYRRPLMV